MFNGHKLSNCMSKSINELKLNLIKYMSKVTIPCVSSKIELESIGNPISSTKIHPIFEGSVVMNMNLFSFFLSCHSHPCTTFDIGCSQGPWSSFGQCASDDGPKLKGTSKLQILLCMQLVRVTGKMISCKVSLFIHTHVIVSV